MPKIQPGTASAAFFNLDGLDYGRFQHQLVYGDVEVNSDGTLDLTKVSVGLIHKYTQRYIQRPTLFSNWTDSSDTPYASVTDLITALDTLVGFVEAPLWESIKDAAVFYTSLNVFRANTYFTPEIGNGGEFRSDRAAQIVPGVRGTAVNSLTRDDTFHDYLNSNSLYQNLEMHANGSDEEFFLSCWIEKPSYQGFAQTIFCSGLLNQTSISKYRIGIGGTKLAFITFLGAVSNSVKLSRISTVAVDLLPQYLSSGYNNYLSYYNGDINNPIIKLFLNGIEVVLDDFDTRDAQNNRTYTGLSTASFEFSMMGTLPKSSSTILSGSLDELLICKGLEATEELASYIFNNDVGTLITE